MSHKAASSGAPLARMLFALLLLALLAAALLMAASASAAPPDARRAGESPDAGLSARARLAAGGAFTAALSVDVLGLDPALASDNVSLLVTSQIYDTLTAYEPGGSAPIPALAQSWSASADGKTWTFNLRPGVNFHDGAPLDAAAVAFNFQRWWDPANPYHNGSFDAFTRVFGAFKGDPNCLLAGVGTAGPLQFQITTTQSSPGLPTSLAMDVFAIASPAAIQAGTLGASPSGTGPYRFVERVTGDHVWLQANTAYWGGAPRLDSLAFRVIPDGDQRLAAVVAGTVQSADAFSDSQVLAALSNPKLQVLWRVVQSIGYLGMNRAHTPLDQPLVREAIAHAIDRPKLIADHYDVRSQVAGQFLPPTIWGYDSSLAGYKYDPAQARSLLEQAGYANGITTTLAYRNVYRWYLPDPPGTANAIAADLQEAGIRADVVEYESSEFIRKAHAGELDLVLLGWGANALHPAVFFGPVFCNPSDLEFGPLDTELCDQLLAAETTFDFAEQLAIFKWASDRVYGTLPLLPLAHQRTALITRREVVGLVPSPASAENYETVRFVHRVYLPVVLR
jgi:peptide/nickel transport system substrate-binding protein